MCGTPSGQNPVVSCPDPTLKEGKGVRPGLTPSPEVRYNWKKAQNVKKERYEGENSSSEAQER